MSTVLPALLLGLLPPGSDAGPARAHGTPRMAQRLADIAESRALETSVYSNRARARSLQRRLRDEGEELSLGELAALEYQLAVERLRAGDVPAAIAGFQGLLERDESHPGLLTPADRYEIASELAVSWLRQGELDNCVARHGPDSCLLPIEGGGVHVDQRGSRAAIDVLEGLLRSFPEDHRARWALNVAYMTVGEYPAEVPAAYLIPPECFESEHELPRFTDVAAAVGLAAEGLAGGCVVEDLDGDLDLDVMVSSMGVRDQLRYFENLGPGGFVERTDEAGLAGLTGGLNLVSGDCNGDGLVDVLVLRGGWFLGRAGCQPNSLLLNQGGGRFSDATGRAGLLSFHPTQTAAFADFDNDGWLDLFVGNESGAGLRHPSELFRNRGDGTFEDVATSLGVDLAAFVKGATFGDYDGDGWTDLYVSCHGAPNRLYHNECAKGRGAGFRQVARQAGVSEPIDSFPTWFFDYDNDGELDLLAFSFAGDEGTVAADYLKSMTRSRPGSALGRPCLYRNQGDGTFRDVAAEAGLDDVLMAMGASYGDLDNDGWLDVYVGTGSPDFRALVPNRMYRNDGGRRFLDVTTSGGFGHLQKGHGIAFADVDNDGDQDVYLDLGGAYESDRFRNALFENPGSGGRHLTLSLVGTRSNRSAIGARLRVHVSEPDGPRVVHALVGTGGSFGAASLRQTVGLSAATRVDRVEVRWPRGGGVEVFAGMELDGAYRLVEGSGRAEALDLPRFRLGGADATPACHQASE